MWQVKFGWHTSHARAHAGGISRPLSRPAAAHRARLSRPDWWQRFPVYVGDVGGPLTAEKVLLAMKGIDYEDVKGEYMGLCFMGKPEKYKFRA